MTSIMSSPGGSAVYSSQLSQLLAANQSADNDDSSTGSVPASSPQTVPSLASVLSTDDTTGVGAQATSTINSLMMEIQALKAGTASTASSTTGSTSNTDGTQPVDQQSGAVHGHHRHHGGGGAQEAAKAFSKIDTDKSGSVSLAEFVAGRPKDMSEDDATKIFKSIDTAGTGSISEDQFAANLKAEHEKAGAAHHAKGTDGTDSQPDMKALAQDLVSQLKEVIQTFNNGYVDGGDGSAPADTVAVG